MFMNRKSHCRKNHKKTQEQKNNRKKQKKASKTTTKRAKIKKGNKKVYHISHESKCKSQPLDHYIALTHTNTAGQTPTLHYPSQVNFYVSQKSHVQTTCSRPGAATTHVTSLSHHWRQHDHCDAHGKPKKKWRTCIFSRWRDAATRKLSAQAQSCVIRSMATAHSRVSWYLRRESRVATYTHS